MNNMGHTINGADWTLNTDWSTTNGIDGVGHILQTGSEHCNYNFLEKKQALFEGGSACQKLGMT